MILGGRLGHPPIRVEIVSHNLDGSMLTFFFAESIRDIIRNQVQFDRDRLVNGWPPKTKYPRRSVPGRYWRLRQDIKHVPNIRSVSLKDHYITVLFVPNERHRYSDTQLRAALKSFFYPFQLSFYPVNR